MTEVCPGCHGGKETGFEASGGSWRGLLEGVIFEQGLNGYLGFHQWSKEDVLNFKNVK